MLVLSRNSGQSIVIDERITVQVIEIRGDRVRLGFSAPREVAIHRQEVFRRIQEEPSNPALAAG